MLAKSLVYFAVCRQAGLLAGSRSPVVLTNRADTAESKMYSMAAGVLTVNRKRALQLKIGKMHY